ncbi:hypothetical protein ACFVT5_07710 [Streptomyces sp. NPDC058001]|uniref:hypothetical protein n=1 Tax=Streptomyces sp. NPDC058001 TaxID=3346300 RepID=UPI0036EABA1C
MSGKVRAVTVALAVASVVVLSGACDAQGAGNDKATPRESDTSAVPSATAPSTATSPAPDTTPQVRLLVNFMISGGYAGRRDQLLLYTDGTYTVSTRNKPSSTHRLDAKALGELRADLKNADLGSLPGRIIDEQARDMFQYRLAHEGHVVITDLTRSYPRLDKVVHRLERLVDAG